jgi:hypothetical protein
MKQVWTMHVHSVQNYKHVSFKTNGNEYYLARITDDGQSRHQNSQRDNTVPTETDNKAYETDKKAKHLGTIFLSLLFI